MSGSPGATGPFGLTPDTRAYVPRAATERALAELVAGVQTGGAPIAIVGPAGVGKTLLLHLLAERAGPGLRSVYLPNPRFGPEEICTWVASALGAPAGDDAEAILRAWLEHLRAKEEACLLLVDDADATPEPTARWLRRLAADVRGGLRLALAALADTESERRLRAFGEIRRVELREEMSPDETNDYVRWQLHRAGVSEGDRARFDTDTMQALHRVAQGNPRRLNLAVEALVRRGSAAVLEDEIAAFAERPLAPPSDRPLAAPPGSSAPARKQGAPDPGPDAADRERASGGPDRETDAKTSPRRSHVVPLLVAGGAVLVVALLLDRDPATPPAPSASGAAVPAAAPAGDPLAAPPPPAGAIAVNVNASPWARIEIDGVDIGETPLAGIPLRPGPHAFRARLPDGRIVERTVEIDAENRHVVFD